MEAEIDLYDTPADIVESNGDETVELAYSPKLEDESADEQDDATEAKAAESQGYLTTQDDFLALLASLPSSAAQIKAAYIGLLALYNYTLGRLQLLEIIGSNGVLTDALISKLFILNAENERLLQSESSSRRRIADLQQQVAEGDRQNGVVETALQDAHHMLQRQEAELDAQSKLIADLQKTAATRSDARSGMNGSVDQQRSFSGRSRQYEQSSRSDVTDRRKRHPPNGHHHSHTVGPHGREEDRRERQASVASSRQSHRRDDNDRDVHGHHDRQREEEAAGRNQGEASHSTNGHAKPREVDQTEKRELSINGAARSRMQKRDPMPDHEPQHIEHKLDSKPLDEDEPEIDLGEDLVEAVTHDQPVHETPAASASSAPGSRTRDASLEDDLREDERKSGYRDPSTHASRESRREGVRTDDAQKRNGRDRHSERGGGSRSHRERDAPRDGDREKDRDRVRERGSERDRDRERSRSSRNHEPSDRHHRDTTQAHERSSRSGNRSRSKSPVRREEAISERSTRERRTPESEGFRSPPRVKHDSAVPTVPKEDRKERAATSQGGRNNNMYGRLGLPLSSGTSREAGISIKGTGRSRNT